MRSEVNASSANNHKKIVSFLAVRCDTHVTCVTFLLKRGERCTKRSHGPTLCFASLSVRTLPLIIQRSLWTIQRQDNTNSGVSNTYPTRTASFPNALWVLTESGSSIQCTFFSHIPLSNHSALQQLSTTIHLIDSQQQQQQQHGLFSIFTFAPW